METKGFKEIFDNVQAELEKFNFAVVAGEFKSYNLFHLAQYAAQLKGSFAEVGVFAGGTVKIISQAVPEKKLYAFDTFEGIKQIDPDKDRKHFLNAFGVKGLEEAAREILKPCENVEILKGWFPNTFYDRKLDKELFSFVHADADVYPSTMSICEVFWPRMVPGGVIVFDDYGYEDTPGARDAVNEFFKDKYEMPSILTGGQAVVFKSDDYWLKQLLGK